MKAARLRLQQLEARDVPSAPVANDDFITANGSIPAVIDVLENDHGTGGAVINPTTVVVTTSPKHGAVSVNHTTGEVTYTAAAGFQGTDTLLYDVRDNLNQLSNIAQVTIVVSRPTANDDVADTDGTNPVEVDVLANDSGGLSALDPATVRITQQPAHGHVTVDHTNGHITYTANEAFQGSDTYKYSVANVQGAFSNDGNVTIVVNRPTANDDAASTRPGQAVIIHVLDNDTDPDGNSEIDPSSVTIHRQPAHGTVTVNGGVAIYSPGANFRGSDSFTYTIRDFPGAGSNEATVRISITSAVTGRKIVAAADAGGQPRILISGANGQPQTSFLAYASDFTGGVHVAVGDVNGDGVSDVVTAPGFGGGPDIKVFSGADFHVIREFFAYDQAFRGGAWVAVADVNNDGFADIITGAGASGGPHVKVFDGHTGAILSSFLAYDGAFHGGVTVAGGDINGDGFADIITGAGAGGGPHVKVFDGHTGATLQSFFAYDAAFRGGVSVAAGDVNATGFASIVTGAGTGGGPQVKVFDRFGTMLESFFAYDPSTRTGVRVGTIDANDDGRSDIVVAAGPGGSTTVRVLDSNTLGELEHFDSFPGFNGGVFVSGK